MRNARCEVRSVGREPTTVTPVSSSSSCSSSKTETFLPVRDYDLAATLDSGQVFRWRQERGRPVREFPLPVHAGEPTALLHSWTGVVGRNVVRLRQIENGILAQTAAPVADWQWLRNFLQTETDLAAILKTFPDDEPMRAAVAACRGLRVLRQEPWECLASFILSSTKQIVQIRQIIALLCERFGESLCCRTGVAPVSEFSFSNGDGRDACPTAFAFPPPEIIASLTESDLRSCKMGFRAPHLLKAARQIAEGEIDLEKIRALPLPEARAELMKLRGVGGKIADCVLLFAYGFDPAFPVDVWVERALRQLYFPRRRVTEKKLRRFAATHFGPHAGYAQQYLFHYMRTKTKNVGAEVTRL
jgi:N-glycosylase/DNA lyase